VLRLRGRSSAAHSKGGKLPTIGFLSGGGPSQNSKWIASFVQRLRELDWIES
jgi:hypothetical protein